MITELLPAETDHRIAPIDSFDKSSAAGAFFGSDSSHVILKGPFVFIDWSFGVAYLVMAQRAV